MVLSKLLNLYYFAIGCGFDTQFDETMIIFIIIYFLQWLMDRIKMNRENTQFSCVAALSHCCRVLFEDECKNAMQESLELFDEICNAKWFKRTQIILFLNMNDLIRERLREGVSLSISF